MRTILLIIVLSYDSKASFTRLFGTAVVLLAVGFLAPSAGRAKAKASPPILMIRILKLMHPLRCYYVKIPKVESKQ